MVKNEELSTPTDTATTEGRNSDGTFANGNQLAKGNQGGAAMVARCRGAMENWATAEKAQALVNRMYEIATGDDHTDRDATAAAKILFPHMFGPVEAVSGGLGARFEFVFNDNRVQVERLPADQPRELIDEPKTG